MIGVERLIRDKDWLKQKYLAEELSTRQIGKLIGVDNSSITYWLKKHEISSRKKGINAKEKNYSWKGGINRRTQKKYAKSILGENCEYCGSPYKIFLHHKDGNPENNKISNLMMLCFRCHFEWHKKHPNPFDGRRLRTVFPPKNELGKFSKGEKYAHQESI
jgi:5-methylcytosine-specific restriction endonuclease McrA